MNSLVFDFENKINDKDYSISDLLRHCLIIASKLKQSDFIEWINSELNGYDNKTPLPKYRKIPVSVKFLNPQYGWCPYVITDEEAAKYLNELPLRVKISEVEELSKSNGDVIRIDAPAAFKKELLSNLDFESDISFEATRISTIGVIDAVKNYMLNWILKLEENDIIDTNLVFNEKQIKKADIITIQFINNINGEKNKIVLNQKMGSD